MRCLIAYFPGTGTMEVVVGTLGVRLSFFAVPEGYQAEGGAQAPTASGTPGAIATTRFLPPRFPS